MTTASSSFDVAIVGGGIAGVTAARHLAPHRSVVLLEQESELAYHTTSRSAAIYLENEGGPVNHRLSTASRPFFEDPPGIDFPIMEQLGAIIVGPPEMGAAFQQQVDDARRVTSSIQFLEGTEITDLCPVIRPERGAVGMWEPGASAIDVMAVHQLFLATARGDRLAVRRSARVTALERKAGHWMISTNAGAVEAKVVVNSAGAWGDIVGAMAGAEPIGLTPLRRTAFTSPIDFDPRGWPMVHTPAPGATCYFKPEAGQQLLCSLADETASEPCDARAEEMDVAAAIDHINALTTLGLRSVRTTWAGLRTFAPDRSPVIGWDDAVADFCWMVGQGGCGIVTSPAAGRCIGAIVLGEDLPSAVTDLGITKTSLAPRR